MSVIWSLKRTDGQEGGSELRKRDNDTYMFSAEDDVSQIDSGSFPREELVNLHQLIGREIYGENEVLQPTPVQDSFRVILQATDRRGVVETEESLYVSSCGVPLIPAQGNSIVWKGVDYHIRNVIWNYDTKTIHILCRTHIGGTIRTVEVNQK